MLCKDSFTALNNPPAWLIHVLDPPIFPRPMLSQFMLSQPHFSQRLFSQLTLRSLLRSLKQVRSRFWWLRKLHPWSAFALIAWRWVVECDRRVEHQLRFQKRLLHLNFWDIQTFCTDFIRPEFWLM